MTRANPEEPWNSFLARLDLSRLPMPVTLSMVEDFEGRQLRIKLHVKDIFDGSPLYVWQTQELPPFESLGDSHRLRAIIDAVMHAVEHEIRECIWLDGRRQDNPHFDYNSPVIWHAPLLMSGPCKCDRVGTVAASMRDADGRRIVTSVRLNNGEVIDPSIDIDLLREYESNEACPWGDRHLAQGCC